MQGLIVVKSNNELEREDKEREESATAGKDDRVVDEMAAYVRRCWDAAVRCRDNPNPVTGKSVKDRMISNLRARLGQYDEDTLSKIRANGASDIYMRVTAVKCRTMAGWLRDVLMGGTGKPWGLKPTPEPSLPTEIADEIEKSVQEMLRIVNEAVMMGDVAPPTQEMISAEYDRQAKAARWEREEHAREVIELMERKIDDQFEEGGFYPALNAFIDDLMVYPTAVMKGPVIRKKARLSWVDGEVVVGEKICAEFERVNPMDIYPSPQSSGPNDGYIIQRHRLNRSGLNMLIGVPGYKEEAIRAALRDYGIGGNNSFSDDGGDTDRQDMESKDSLGGSTIDPIITALEYYGSVQGRMLTDWGVEEEDIDPDLDYECVVWVVGEHVIKAVLNPDPLNRRPYHTASFEDIPDSFWKLSLADNLADCQAMCNASARAIDRNMAIASGPQVVLNTDRYEGTEDSLSLYPWKVWLTKNDPLGNSASPVSFFQPSSNAQELFAVFQQFYTLADEFSAIPRYMQGMPSSANRTATGLSMLMNAASKGVKQVIGNIDMAVQGLVERIYNYNMLFDPDPSIKGDVQVVAMGSTLLGQKDLQQLRVNEFLQATANPIDSQITGMEGRAYLLKETARSLGFDPDKIIPPRQEDQLGQMPNPMQGMSPGATGDNMDPAGGAPSPTGQGMTLETGAPIQRLT